MVASRFACSLLTCLSLTGAASAAEVRGVISKVDLANNQLKVIGRGPDRGTEWTFHFEGESRVLFGRKVGALSDLKEGRRARVEYDLREGRAIARIVHATGPGPAQPARRPAGPAPAPRGDGVTGVLRRVALTDREIVIVGPGPRGKETETTLAVPETVRVMKGNKAIAFDALQEGETVSVRVERRDGKAVAVAIQVGPGSAVPGPRGMNPDLIPKARLLLQLADRILQQMEDKR